MFEFLKRLVKVVLVFGGCSVAAAQPQIQQVWMQSTAPSGACPANSPLVESTVSGPGIYQCISGTWTKIASATGVMTWPATAGVAVYAGSSNWGTSLTAPSGSLVGTTDTQTLTNKTVDTVTPTQFGYLSSITSDLQTQLNNKSPLAGSASLVTLGTVTSGTWGAVTIDVAHGGTGATSTDAVERFVIDTGRTDTYTADGSVLRPYKTLDSLAAAVNAYVTGGGSGPVVIDAYGAASMSAAAVFPAVATTIHAHNATWTFSSGVTVNALPMTIYDLNTVGNVTYASCSSTARNERHGGSYTGGNIVIGAGCYQHWYGVQASGSGGYTITTSGTLAADFMTGGAQIISGGAAASVLISNSNLQRSSGYNIDMTGGGIAVIKDSFLTTVAGTANIYCPTANTLAGSHGFLNLSFLSGTGVSCGASTYYSYDSLSADPVGALGYSYYSVGSTSNHVATRYVSRVFGSNSVTCTPGVGMGTGGTCVCATNHRCDNLGGELTATTGTGTTTGLTLTLTLYGSSQSVYPSCQVDSNTGTSKFVTGYTTETSTGFYRTATTAPDPSTVYTLHYNCQ